VIEPVNEPAKKIMPGLDEPISVEDLEKYELPARAAWLVMNPASRRMVDEWWHTMVPATKAAIEAWQGV
jgi:hypothetical protein